MAKKETVAKMLRIITVPPILVTGFLIVLALTREDIFQSRLQIGLSILLLGVVPLLAYPLQPLLPGFRGKGRAGQRALAFVLNLTGYAAAVAVGYCMRVSENLHLIYNTYLLSALVLTVVNKMFHIRASGHMCSAAGPLVFLIYYVGWQGILPCAVIGCGVVWSSLRLKRHRVRELLMGAGVCLASFGCAWLFSQF